MKKKEQMPRFKLLKHPTAVQQVDEVLETIKEIIQKERGIQNKPLAIQGQILWEDSSVTTFRGMEGANNADFLWLLEYAYLKHKQRIMFDDE